MNRQDDNRKFQDRVRGRAVPQPRGFATRYKDQTAQFCILIRLQQQAKRIDPIVGSIVRNGSFFYDFIFVVISYIEVSNETSDEVTIAIITISN